MSDFLGFRICAHRRSSADSPFCLLHGSGQAHEFERTAPGVFSNGRAALRIEGHRLTATPGDGGRSYSANLAEATTDTLQYLLANVLAAPSFRSANQLQRDAVNTARVEAGLAAISGWIAASPDNSSSVRLRQFLWSIWNAYHAVNLWDLGANLERHHINAVRDVFTAWMDGHVSEDAVEKALIDSGEMDRWDTARLSPPERQRVAAAIDAVGDVIQSSPPGPHSLNLNRANNLLIEALDYLERL